MKRGVGFPQEFGYRRSEVLGVAPEGVRPDGVRVEIPFPSLERLDGVGQSGRRLLREEYTRGGTTLGIVGANNGFQCASLRLRDDRPPGRHGLDGGDAEALNGRS